MIESDVSDANVVVDDIVFSISTIAIVYDDDDDGDEDMPPFITFNKSGLLLQRLWNESLFSSLDSIA